MTHKIDLAKMKLDEEKKRLKKMIVIKEKKIKDREKKHQFSKLVEIGKFASKASIDSIEGMVLFGAFLEISQKKDEQVIVENWRKKAEEFLKNSNKNETVSLSIKFSSPPTKVALDKLKELKFKWNRFRKEFYGLGNKDDLAKLFIESNCIIEEIL